MKMRKVWVVAAVAVLLIMLCGCQGSPRISIPLIKITNPGECGLFEWDVEKNEIVDLGKPLFENHEDPHSLERTLWNGHDQFILADDRTRVLETNSALSVNYRKSNREAFSKNYTLLKESDGSYALKGGDQDSHFRIELSVSIDGKDVRGDQLGRSGFYVDDTGQTLSILLNSFSFELNRIVLYIYRMNLADGTSQIHDVKDCPTTLSPALPPAGTNVLAIDGSFHVLSSKEVSTIAASTQVAETTFDVSTLRNSRYFNTKTTHGYLMTRLGYYEGRYIISVVADPQTVSEATYLCLVDRGSIVAAIKVDSEYIAPNL